MKMKESDRFDQALYEIAEEEGGNLLYVPGVYEALSEHLNNEILSRIQEDEEVPEAEASEQIIALGTESYKEDMVHVLAREILFIETLDVRGRDHLDFHALSVALIHKALEAAFDAGQKASEVTP